MTYYPTLYKRIAPLTAGGNRESGIPEQRDIAFLSRTTTLGIEEDTDLMQDDEVPDSQDSSTMRSTESPPPAGNFGTEASEVEDEDDEDYRPSYSVRRRLTQNTILTPATDSATITTTSTKTTVLARTIDSAATSITSTTTPMPRAPFSPQVGKDPWLNSTRRGNCVLRSVRCHMPQARPQPVSHLAYWWAARCKDGTGSKVHMPQ